eukprot:m.46892 g.46892  ORF g.46892 m.46892 type:complete len:1201 (-) comp11886_c0_seq2:75-3677(-)
MAACHECSGSALAAAVLLVMLCSAGGVSGQAGFPTGMLNGINEWEIVQETISDIPTDLISPAYCLLQVEPNFVFTYGGAFTFASKTDFSSFFHSYNIATSTWTFYAEPLISGLPSDGRAGHTMVSFKDQYILLIFGGLTSGPPTIALGKTVVYTPTNQLNIVSKDSRDTPWVFQTMESTNPPSARYFHTATVLNQKCMVVFGGIVASNGASGAAGTVSDETWLLNMDTLVWTQVESLLKPQPRAGHSAEVSPHHENTLYMFGGCGKANPLFPSIASCEIEYSERTWKFNMDANDTACTSGAWSEIVVPTPSTVLAGSVSVVSRNTIIQWAGATQGVVVDTMNIFDVTTESWHIQPSLTPQVPDARMGAMMLYLATSDKIIVSVGTNWLFVHGGQIVWYFDPSVSAWYPVDAQTRPGPRFASQMVRLETPIGDQLVLFGGLAGGQNGPETLSQTWFYSLKSRTWYLSSDTSPPPRVGFNLVTQDNARLYVAFGNTFPTLGAPRVNMYSDVWSFSYLDGWRVVSGEQPGGPAGRAVAAAAIVDDELLFFGGFLNNTSTNQFKIWDGVRYTFTDELWSLNLTTTKWKLYPRKGLWPKPQSAGGYGVIDGRLVMYGGLYQPEGQTVAATVPQQLWVLDLTLKTWTLQTQIPGQTWPVNLLPSFVPLPGNHKALLFGGLLVGPTGHISSISSSAHVGSFNPDGQWVWSLIEGLELEVIQAAVAVVNTDEFFDPRAEASLAIAAFGGAGIKNLIFEPLDQLWALQLGCNTGEYISSYEMAACKLCPAGTYSDSPGRSSCRPCPGDTSTLEAGATSVTMCSVCRSGVCSHGLCTVLSTGVVHCACDLGFRGKFCETNALAILLGSLFGSMAALALLVAGAVCWRKSDRKHKVYSALQDRLLEETQFELTQLSRAWDILPSEVVLRKRLADGGFGEVWTGIYQEKDVCVKRMHAVMVEFDEHAATDFEREVSVMKRLRHANIVFFYGAGVDDGIPFLVTEHVRRGSLHQMLYEQGPTVVNQLTAARCITILLHTARGMCFLHEQQPPLLHRDLKSGNILISESWTAKVADFGTARLAGSLRGDENAFVGTAAVSMLTRGVGTLLWCAPEVWTAESYGSACDVYSFAIVIYELLHRKPPFAHLQVSWEIREAVTQGQRPEVEPVVDGIPQSVVSLMTTCWQAQPEERPTFADVVTMLELLDDDVAERPE